MISEKLIEEIKRRVIEAVHPLKIIVFGSAGRGQMGPDSDVDLLVVMPSDAHRRDTARSIYRNLIGVGFAVDVVVVTERDIDRYKDNVGMVIKPALEQGRLLYAE